MVDEFTQWADRCKSSASFVKSACSDLRKIHRCVILITHSDTLTGLGDAKGLRDAIDHSAVKLQLETQMNRSGEYEPTGYGWLQYPGQEKQRVKIPRSIEPALPASTAPTVELLMDDRTRLEQVYQSQVAENHPVEATLSHEKNIAPFLHYFTTAKAKYGDREGWVNITKLQQNWGKHNRFNAESFNQFLQHLAALGIGKFHPENPALWTDSESTPS